MINDSLTLIVCSNRENDKPQIIWHQIINNKYLKKIVFSTQGLAKQNIINHIKIIQLKLESKGRSNALNEALSFVHSGIIGLTDDDCILSKNWVQHAIKTFYNCSVDLVYGQTKSYQPHKHIGYFCPSTFKKPPNNVSITEHIGKHWIDIGFDNNAVIKKQVFDNIGGYKWWLGPGSVIPAAEDAEFILRAQIAGYKIAYNPKMIVFHNKWLSEQDHEDLMLDYALGGIVVYAFYAFQGVKECRSIALENIRYFLNEIKMEIKNLLINRGQIGCKLRNIFLILHNLIKGLFIAFVFSKIILIPEKENVVKRYYRQ